MDRFVHRLQGYLDDNDGLIRYDVGQEIIDRMHDLGELIPTEIFWLFAQEWLRLYCQVAERTVAGGARGNHASPTYRSKFESAIDKRCEMWDSKAEEGRAITERFSGSKVKPPKTQVTPPSALDQHVPYPKPQGMPDERTVPSRNLEDVGVGAKTTHYRPAPTIDEQTSSENSNA